MDRRLGMIAAAAIPALAVLFYLLSRIGTRPLIGLLAAIAIYWLLLAAALWRNGGWSLRLRPPSRPALLALAALVIGAAVAGSRDLSSLSLSVLAVVALAAAINGTLEEAFWRGALVPRPGPGGWRAALPAMALFVAWHIAPAAGMAGIEAPGGVAGLFLGAAVMAPAMMAARLSSGTAGAAALAHVAINFFLFASLAARNGAPV
ncbi:CAAX protease self-immunity [Paracoccus halophilus]|uniref:CAAX protease self-immunity n=1 Tax=Paracoccus halophilus TaxID=376733 RepID=A0A099F862_9RHOB|nr:CPBP family glutamic-type intramembrane protease [Paracoccus halophilus]KGJ06699.1 hypothetical protein IT41_00545 [Paracoccus halophilus]SFA42115.1 CAAX protease self-immunity [Paracoccus halophilus]